MYQINLPPNEKLRGDDRIFSWKERRKRYFEIVNEIIERTSGHGPGGFLHAWALSTVLKRVIRIWKRDQVVYAFGKKNGRAVIDVEYRERGQLDSRLGLGHWSLRGGREPGPGGRTAATTAGPPGDGRPNDCLYDVVASQTGIEGGELRRRAANAMRRNQRTVVRYILTSGNPALVTGMLGGARYAGSSPRDAQRLLDDSQSGQCHPEGRSGHPRGHASHPSAQRNEDSVETYSYSRWRSGFLSRDDQDIVCHYALTTNRAQDLMARLNDGQYKVAEHIHRSSIDFDPLPQAQVWSGGQRQGSPEDFNTVCLVGKHFYNQQNNPSAPLFILTFYPIL